MTSLVKESLRDLCHRHGLKIRFIVVGAWNTVFGYLIFLLADLLLSHWVGERYVAYMAAMVISYILAIMNAYVWHKRITFRSGTKGTAMLVEFIRFCTTYLFTFFLSLILLPALVEICYLDPRVAAALVLFICTVLSYLGHSRFSFGGT